MEYFEEVYNYNNSTVLTLQGVEEESGSYSCQLSNYLGESYKNFTVTFTETPEVIDNTTLIIAVTVAAVFVLVTLIIGVKIYIDQV